MTRFVTAALLVIAFNATPANAQCATSLVEATTTDITWCGPADEYLAPFKKGAATAWTPAPTIPAAAWTPVATPQGTPGALCWTAAFTADSGDVVAVDSCTPPTPTPRPTVMSGGRFQNPIGAVVKQTSQSFSDTSHYPLLDFPGTDGRNCIEWIEVSSAGETLVEISSSSMAVDFPFPAGGGYVFREQKGRCFPVGEIVSVTQTSSPNDVRINVSYFRR